MIKLQVYTSADCWSCQETERIVSDMTSEFPDVAFEMLEMEAVQLPDNVFAVPTYVLDGRVISLGNPTRADLRQWLHSARLKGLV